jgi:cytochrome P450
MKERKIMGHTIPAGSAVMAPTWFIHHDPELWPDPWKFDPERFSPENKQVTLHFISNRVGWVRVN